MIRWPNRNLVNCPAEWRCDGTATGYGSQDCVDGRGAVWALGESQPRSGLVFNGSGHAGHADLQRRLGKAPRQSGQGACNIASDSGVEGTRFTSKVPAKGEVQIRTVLILMKT
eukprot:Gb_18156 [translate_table: standard]